MVDIRENTSVIVESHRGAIITSAPANFANTTPETALNGQCFVNVLLAGLYGVKYFISLPPEKADKVLIKVFDAGKNEVACYKLVKEKPC